MASPFLSVITKDKVSFNPLAASKKEVLTVLLELATRDLDLDEAGRHGLLKAVLDREKAGSTGVGGVAIPHVKHRAVKTTVAALGVFPDGTDFHAVDAEPVYSVFMLLSPADAAEEHIQTLRSIATLARKPDYTRFVRQVKSGAEAYELLEELGE